MAQRHTKHADLATASAISQLKATMKSDDAFLLFRGMVYKDEDLDDKVQDSMMKRSSVTPPVSVTVITCTVDHYCC